MARRLLFVCAMNVCRSPLAACTFAAAVAENGDPAEWTVASAGTAALPGEAICGVGATLLAKKSVAASLAQSHISERIDAARLRDYDMILVATRAERSLLATLDPAARDYTFTIKEAVLLGSRPISAEELAAGPSAPHRRSRLVGYPTLLHRRRGTVSVPAPRQPKAWLPWRSRAVQDPLDIRDVHVEDRRQHEPLLRELQADVLTLHRQLTGFLALRS